MDSFEAVESAVEAYCGSIETCVATLEFESEFPDSWLTACQHFVQRTSHVLRPIHLDSLRFVFGTVSVFAGGLPDSLLEVSIYAVPPLPEPLSKAMHGAVSELLERCATQASDAPVDPERQGAGAVRTEANADRHVQVFSGPALSSIHDVARDDDTSARLRKTYKRLRASGPSRPLRRPAHDWSAQLDELAKQFPNFRHVVDSHLRPHLALVALGAQARMPPLLLLGPPGIGKTYFASQLADRVFRSRFSVLSMCEETNGGALIGSSTFWSNASPGRCFELLAWGESVCANPLILVDEVDKAGSDLRYDPLAGLYGLLEASTAQVFQDQSLPDLTINAAHIRWVLTANSIDPIPVPLRSRMAVYEVAEPSNRDRIAIAQGIFHALLAQFAIEFATSLPEDVLQSLSGVSPRLMKARLEIAVGLAAMDHRRALTLSDWLRSERGDARKVSMGFSA